VRNPTSVAFKSGVDTEYYLNRVGGLAKSADKKEIHVVRADGSAVSGFANLREITPGDTIIVPPKEEERFRALPTIRDTLGFVGALGTSIISLAALAILF
jgi:hypothetical protein